MATVIEAGNRIRVHYTTKSLEGCVIEASASRNPLVFTAGSDEVLLGISRGVVGMAVGETRTLTLTPEQGFGRRKKELELSVRRDRLPPGAAVGDQLKATWQHGEIPVWVQKVSGDDILLDGNHPLAGETLIVDLTVVGLDA